MSGKTEKKQQLSLIALVLMIFTSVFGFTNMPRSFYLMGYSAIPWFIAAAVLFFIPYAFMIAEYGAAFKNEKGGIFSWMEISVNTEYAFIGTFMWYASYIIWMVNVANGLWIPFSTMIFGTDTTQNWGLNLGFMHLSSVQFIGILAILWMIFVTFTASRGLDKISKFTSVGGTAVALLNVVLIGGAILVLIGNHGQFAQLLTHDCLISSPHPDYQNTMGVLSFLVFALFSYGGIEVVGGLVDSTKDPEKNFPRGIIFSAIIIMVGYAIGILLCGAFTNWKSALSGSNINMANIAYLMMQNLGLQLGLAFGASKATSLAMGAWLARIVGLSMFLSLIGGFFTLIYAPLKQLIEGAPKGFWPGKMGELTNGMPRNAMNIQAAIVIVIIALIAFGGSGASAFFNKLILMTNVAMTIPYAFISMAFIYFKRNKSIKKPFEMYKSNTSATIAAIVVTITVLFANIFTIINPALNGNLSDTLWMIAGPIVFTIMAIMLFRRYKGMKDQLGK